MRKSLKIVNEVCNPRSTSKIQLDCQIGSDSLTLIHIRSASDFPVQSKLLVKICVVLPTLQATSCPVKVMTSRFDSDSPHRSLHVTICFFITAANRTRNFVSIELSHEPITAIEPLTSVYDDCPESVPHSSRPSLQRRTSDPNSKSPLSSPMILFSSPRVTFPSEETHRYAPYFSMVA